MGRSRRTSLGEGNAMGSWEAATYTESGGKLWVMGREREV